MGFFGTTIKLLTGTEPAPKLRRRGKVNRRQLIRMESKIGAQLFGTVPTGHRREFFCLDRHTWIWYEEWAENGKRRELTTRYEVSANGVLKVQDGQPYQVVEGEELRNLELAMRLYRDRTFREIYQCDPLTGQPLQAA